MDGGRKDCCGVSDLWPSLPDAGPVFWPEPNKPGPAERDGESIFTSSLIPDDEPLGMRDEGGGVTRVPATLLVSEKVSQKFLPFEFFKACCLKLLDKPESVIISSSGMSSRESCAVPRFGED